MLVLSRKIGETIDIGGGLITLQVTSICGDKVRIGITAPKELAVHRSEVLAKILAEQRPEPDAEAA